MVELGELLFDFKNLADVAVNAAGVWRWGDCEESFMEAGDARYSGCFVVCAQSFPGGVSIGGVIDACVQEVLGLATTGEK